MKIINRTPAEIFPYKKNNRIHTPEQIQKIADSIGLFGFNQPVVVDESSVVLVGHGRLEAAKLLGLELIPCVELLGLSEDQKKAYRILDNKIQNDSTWDFGNLETELAELSASNFDFAQFGLGDLDELIQDNSKLIKSQIEVVEDEAPEPPKKTLIKSGDIIELGAHRLMCGDSTNAQNISDLLDGTTPQLCFTDPPYGVNYEGGHFHSGNVKIKRKTEKLKGDETTKLYSEFLSAWLPIVDGPFYVFHADTCPHELYTAIKDNDAEISALLIWHKINAKYAAMNAQYKQRHEPCLYFKPKGRVSHWCGPSDECTIWEEKRDAQNTLHPTQKPICLAARAIKNHDIKIVCDPFSGSGSTLIACEQLDRICYGMELEPKYCHVIVKRYATERQRTGKPIDIKINGEPFPVEWIDY